MNNNQSNLITVPKENFEHFQGVRSKGIRIEKVGRNKTAITLSISCRVLNRNEQFAIKDLPTSGFGHTFCYYKDNNCKCIFTTTNSLPDFVYRGGFYPFSNKLGEQLLHDAICH